MKSNKLLLILVSIFICLSYASSQNISDVASLKGILMPKAPPQKEFINTVKKFSKENTSEVNFALMGLFTIYKSFFSNQDFNKCNFYPSCSEYGLLAIRYHGLIKGGAVTFDRLARCHPLSLMQYEFDFNKKIFLDPVK